MILALSIASWFTAARIVRGQIISLKQNDYVRAAHAVGARWQRVLFRHLLPNTSASSSSSCSSSSGSDPGRGLPLVHRPRINPPDASWGSMAQEGRDAYRVYRSSSSRASSSRPRPLRELHRGRRSRRPRPAHAGDPPFRGGQAIGGRSMEVDDLRTYFSHQGGHRPRRRRGLLLGGELDARDRRRVGLRQVRHRALDHGPDPEAAGEDRERVRCCSTAAISRRSPTRSWRTSAAGRSR